MYHEQTENIQPASKLRQIMILRNLAGRLKKQVESVERETKNQIHHGATASQTRTANGSAPHVAADSKQFLTTEGPRRLLGSPVEPYARGHPSLSPGIGYLDELGTATSRHK